MLFAFWFCVYYVFFPQKVENNRLKKASWPKFCNIIFWFLLKVPTKETKKLTLFCLNYFH